MTQTVPARRWRRWLVAFAVLAVLAIGAVAALPFALSTLPARRWLLAGADRVLAPGRLEVASFRFSWFGPTRMTGFVIRDPQGDRVVISRRATWDRNLRDILFDRPRYGTLRLDDAALDIERQADGSVDLYEALKPILGPDPKVDLTIRIPRGRLRFRDHMRHLLQPVVADRADLVLRRPPAPKPITWRLDLAQGPGPKPATLSFLGRYVLWGPGATDSKDLAISLTGDRWPLDVEVSGLAASARLLGDLQMMRHKGRWDFGGSAQFREIDVRGRILAGDRLRWDRARAVWQVSQRDEGWTLQALDVESPIGSVQARGLLAAAGVSRIDGRLDLAALAGQLPHALRLPPHLMLERGSVTVQAVANTDAGGTAWKLDGRIAELVARQGDDQIRFSRPGLFQAKIAGGGVGRETQLDARLDLGDSPWSDGPLALAVAAVYSPKSDDIVVSRFALKEHRGTIVGHGRLRDPRGRRLAEIEGTVTPDWSWVNQTLASRVEPNARLEGKPVTIRARGRLSGPWQEVWKDLDAEARFDLISADVYGLQVGPTAIVARGAHGVLGFDAIDTTVNGGRVHLEPKVVGDERGNLTLVLGPGSKIAGAQINDEVSHRFLAYVVPVMDRATRARGKISVDLERAEFPIGEGSSQKSVVEGQVVFRDVEFAPGPLAEDLLAMVGRRDVPAIKVDQPVVLSISGGKVHQQGLSIPFGKLRIDLAGTVDFDRRLDLMASVPLTSELFGDRGLLADVVGGTRLKVPIRGTLSAPKIDKEAFNLALKRMGTDLLRRGAARGAAELLFRLAQPRDPDAPPPARMTPEERRARRLERQEERRRQREGP